MISSFVLAYLAIAYRLVATSKMACWALVVAVADFRGASACFWTTRELLVRTQLGQPCFYGAHEGQEEEAGRRERGSGRKGAQVRLRWIQLRPIVSLDGIRDLIILQPFR